MHGSPMLRNAICFTNNRRTVRTTTTKRRQSITETENNTDRRTDRSPPKSTHTLSLYVSASAVSLPYDNGGRSDSRWTGKKLGFWVFVDEDTIFQISLSYRDVSGHPQSSLHWYSHKRSKDFILKGVRWADPARFMGTSFWKLKHNVKLVYINQTASGLQQSAHNELSNIVDFKLSDYHSGCG